MGSNEFIPRKSGKVWGVNGEPGVCYEKEREKSEFQNTKNLRDMKQTARRGAVFGAGWKTDLEKLHTTLSTGDH